MFERFLWCVFAPDNGAGENGLAQIGLTPLSGLAAAGSLSGDTGSTPQTPPDSASAGHTAPASDPVTLPRDKFNERLAHERAAGVRELFTALGFEVSTPDALTAAQTELRELLAFAKQQKEAQMSADERVQAQLDTARQQATAAESQITVLTQERDQATARLQEFTRRSTILQAAANAVYPEDVYQWTVQHQRAALDQIIKADQPLFDAAGVFNPAAIDHEAAKTIVADCLKARPEWFKRVPVGSPTNAHSQPPVGKLDPQTFQERLRQAAHISRL